MATWRPTRIRMVIRILPEPVTLFLARKKFCLLEREVAPADSQESST